MRIHRVPESSATQVVLLVMVVVVLTGLMISTRRRLAQSKRAAGPGVRQQFDRLQYDRKAVRDVEQVMIELDQVARQVHGRLDTRLAKLEVLIRDADARIDTLSRVIRRADGGPAIDLTLNGVAPAGAPVPDPPECFKPGVDDRYGDIYRLADGGVSPRQIADETQRTIGEVELILSLRRTSEDRTKTPSDSAVLPASASQ